MEAGSLFTKHPDPSQWSVQSPQADSLRSSRVLLFYSSGDGVFLRGSLFFCAPGGQMVESFSNRIEIDSIKGMFPGQVTSLYPAGKGPFLRIYNSRSLVWYFYLKVPSGASEDRCLTFKTLDGRTVVLEAMSLAQLVAWMSGVHHVLTTSGHHVALKENPDQEEDGKSQIRFCVEVNCVKLLRELFVNVCLSFSPLKRRILFSTTVAGPPLPLFHPRIPIYWDHRKRMFLKAYLSFLLFSFNYLCVL